MNLDVFLNFFDVSPKMYPLQAKNYFLIFHEKQPFVEHIKMCEICTNEYTMLRIPQMRLLFFNSV